MQRFNLTTSPWIPIGGRLLSLRDLFTNAHELPSWFGGPLLFGPGFTRWATAISHRIGDFDITNPAAFTASQTRMLDSGRFDPRRVDAYFDEWEHRFDLLDPTHPFGQSPDASPARLSGTDMIVLNRSGASTKAHLDHLPQATALPYEAAAAQLVVALWYAAGGARARLFGSTHQGAKPSPLRDRISMHPVGDTLFETLVLNTVHPTDCPGADGLGAPFWELPERDPNQASPPPVGLLEYLAPYPSQAAALRVVDGRIVAAGTARWPEHPSADVDVDPFTPARIGKDGTPKALQGKAAATLWRDLPALTIHAGAVAGAIELKIASSAGRLQRVRKESTHGWIAIHHEGDRNKAKDQDAGVSVHRNLLDAQRAAAVRHLAEATRAGERLLAGCISGLLKDLTPRMDKKLHREWIETGKRSLWASAEGFETAIADDELPHPDEVEDAVASWASDAYRAATQALPGDMTTVLAVTHHRPTLKRKAPTP